GPPPGSGVPSGRGAPPADGGGPADSSRRVSGPSPGAVGGGGPPPSCQRRQDSGKRVSTPSLFQATALISRSGRSVPYGMRQRSRWPPGGTPVETRGGPAS